jgi:hypothetical protein
MTQSKADIDKIASELHQSAKSYAEKAAGLAKDPYFREAVMKVSVSGFVWALYHAFKDDFARAALNQELKIQNAAVDRAVSGSEKVAH